MRAACRWIAGLSMLAWTGTCAAAELRPRVLDVAVGPSARIATLDKGRKVIIDWIDDQGTGGGLVVDVATGGVVRTFDKKPARETLTDSAHERGREMQDRIEVVLEKTRDTGEWSDPVRVLDAADAALLVDLQTHERPLAAARTANGIIIVSGGQNIMPRSEKSSFTIRLWDAGKPSARWSFDVPTTKPNEDTYASAAVTLSPDGRWVTAVRDHVLYLLDVATGTERVVARLSQAWSGKGGHGLAVGFSRDGKLIYVVGGGDASGETIVAKRLTDLGDIRRIPVPNEYRVRHIVEHDAGRVLELGGVRQTMFLDTKTSQFLRHDRGSSINSYRLVWLGNGYVWRASRSRRSPITYAAYRHTGGTFEQVYKREWTGGNMAAMTWSPNGRCVLMSGGGKSVLLAPDSGRDIASLAVTGDAFATATFAKNGASLVAINETQKVLVYDMPAVCGGR